MKISSADGGPWPKKPNPPRIESAPVSRAGSGDAETGE